uniref:Myb-like domain-containing protein n=2 Tax=Wuchereria bancrofti TaxID=6293 RepID=A0AAF5PMV3_WUCBA
MSFLTLSSAVFSSFFSSNDWLKQERKKEMYSQQKGQQAVIDLKLWIFKFIRNDKDEFAVCVEGYRKKDIEERELENWRSTAIKERYNSMTLLTISGSKYVLHGVLDQDSAYALGYPKTLIERFKDGFPYEWRELLCDYYSNVIKPNKLNASQGLYSMLLSGVFLDISKCSRTDGHRVPASRNVSSLSNCNAKRVKPLFIKDKIVEEDEESSRDKLSSSKLHDNCTISTNGFSINLGTSIASSSHDSSEQKVISKCDNHFMSAGDDMRAAGMKMSVFKETFEDKSQEDIFKMPLLPLQRRRPKPVALYNWTIRFSANDLGHSKLFPNFAFVVVGFRPDKNLDWKTSCIVAVEGTRLLRTETCAYELMGPINTILAAQQGFPKEFVTQFLNGFPKDWHRILSLFFNTYIEPQLPPQQSLTISEIHDDDEVENLHRSGFQQSVKSYSSDDSDSDSSDCDGSSSSESIQNCRKDLKYSTSRKSVRYRIENSYHVKPGKRRDNKYRQSKDLVLPAKRVKLEGKSEDSVDLSVLKTTRSGRAVKPRLATWTGQRIVYNVHGSPIKTIGITTDSIYSTSASDSSLSTLRAMTLRKTLGKENRKPSPYNVENKRVPLVSYSDSKSSFSSSDDDRKLSPPAPVTPFRGKHGHRSSRMIISSPEEGMKEKQTRRHKIRERQSMKEKTTKRHKIRKRQIKTCRKTRSKQKNQSKKSTCLKARAERKDDEGQNSVKEAVPIVSFSDVESENGVENARNTEVANDNITKNAKNTQPKKWTGNDNTRLKLAVRAIYPQSEKDWENVAASIRTRTAEECRKQALEVLKLNITPKESKTTDVSADVVDALRKTKVGTLAYQIQADRFTRQYLKAGDASDFFEETMDIGSNGRKVAMMPSVTTFDSDDSLLSVLRTPTPKSVRRNIRREKLIRIPESPDCSTPKVLQRDSYVPFRFDPDDETYREQQLRYVHKILKVRNQYGRNRANVAKPSISKNYHLQVPTTQCHQNDSDKESEPDEYFEEETD